MRYLGIDYGTRKIGLALSDDAGTMGFPHRIIQNTPGTLDEIVQLIEDEHVGGVVMGDSLDYAGKQNPVAKAARAFANELVERVNVVVHFEPEMLTTQEARRDYEGVHVSRSGDVDASAAAIILTSYLRDHG